MAYEYLFLAGVLIIVGGVFIIYNRLVQLRERCNDAWSQIDIQMKQRYDLIPNLVEVVKGYAKHEKGVFERIALARSGFSSAKNIGDIYKASEEISTSIRSVIAVAENYPELKANGNFIHLQDQIEDAEERIAYQRTFYNETVLNYNNSISILPWNLVAGIAGMNPREYFGATAAERKVVEIKNMDK